MAAEDAALTAVPGLPGVLLLYGGRAWDNSSSSGSSSSSRGWRSQNRLLLLDTRTSPAAAFTLGADLPPPGGNAAAPAGNGTTGVNGTMTGLGGNTGGRPPPPAHDVRLDWQGGDLLISCAGGWAAAGPLAAYSADAESDLKRWFAVYRIQGLLNQIQAELYEVQGGGAYPSAAAVVVEAATTAAVAAAATAAAGAARSAALARNSSAAAAAAAGAVAAAAVTAADVSAADVAAAAADLGLVLLPDLWRGLVREHIYVSGLASDTMARLMAAHSVYFSALASIPAAAGVTPLNGSTNGTSSYTNGTSLNSTNSSIVSSSDDAAAAAIRAGALANATAAMPAGLGPLWNAALGGGVLDLGPAAGRVADGSALGDSDLSFVKQVSRN